MLDERYNKPVANSTVILREEFDDWAILFDPDTGNAFGLAPIGAFIWKHLDGKYTIDDILKKLQENYEGVPREAKSHLIDFVEELVKKGLLGYRVQLKKPVITGI